MTVDDVKADYEKERAMVVSWRDKDVPGSTMSDEYKDGWTKYLSWVVQISDRMIAMCDGKNTSSLIATLYREADVYDALAEVANLTELAELSDMLHWEATSRRMIADSLK